METNKKINKNDPFGFNKAIIIPEDKKKIEKVLKILKKLK